MSQIGWAYNVEGTLKNDNILLERKYENMENLCIDNFSAGGPSTPPPSPLSKGRLRYKKEQGKECLITFYFFVCL